MGGGINKDFWPEYTPMPQSEFLQECDGNTQLIASILPSLVGNADVDASKVHIGLASTEFPTPTQKSFLTNLECEQLQRFLQQEDS